MNDFFMKLFCKPTAITSGIWKGAVLCLCVGISSCDEDENHMPDKTRKMEEGENQNSNDLFAMVEFKLIRRIILAESQEERAQLISELDSAPVEMYAFHERWFRINDNDQGSWSAWTETTYDSTLCEISRDIQLLAAVNYGKAGIENGGFHQFFTNSTGVFAPEMIEWFERAGLDEAAAIMKEAVAKFGIEFPRSQDERSNFLDKFRGDSNSERDPFYELNEPFYNIVTRKEDRYNAVADKWLKNVCGISSLQSKGD